MSTSWLLTRGCDLTHHLFGFLAYPILLTRVAPLNRSAQRAVQSFLAHSLHTLRISAPSLLHLCANRKPSATRRIIQSLFSPHQPTLKELILEVPPYACHRWNLLLLLSAFTHCTCENALNRKQQKRRHTEEPFDHTTAPGGDPRSAAQPPSKEQTHVTDRPVLGPVENDHSDSAINGSHYTDDSYSADCCEPDPRHQYLSTLERLVITTPAEITSVDAVTWLETSRRQPAASPPFLEIDRSAHFFHCAQAAADYRFALKAAVHRATTGRPGKRRRQQRSLPELVSHAVDGPSPDTQTRTGGEESGGSGLMLRTAEFWAALLRPQEVWLEKVDWTLVFQWFPNLKCLSLELGIQVAHCSVSVVCFQLPLDLARLRQPALPRSCFSSLKSITLTHATSANLSLGGDSLMAFDHLESLAIGFDEIEIMTLDLRSLFVAQVSEEDSNTAVCESLRRLCLTTQFRDLDAQAATVLLLLRSFEATPPAYHDSCRFWRFPYLETLQIPALRLASPELLPEACPGLRVLRCLHAAPPEVNETTTDALRLKLLLERCPLLTRLEIWTRCDVRSLTAGLENLSAWATSAAAARQGGVGVSVEEFESVAWVARRGVDEKPGLPDCFTIDCEAIDDSEAAALLLGGSHVLFTCAAGWTPRSPSSDTFFLMH